MSKPESERELSPAESTDAIARVMPRVLAITASVRELERAAHSCVIHNGGFVVGNESYVRVRREDLDALQVAIEELRKARAL